MPFLTDCLTNLCNPQKQIQTLKTIQPPTKTSLKMAWISLSDVFRDTCICVDVAQRKRVAAGQVDPEKYIFGMQMDARYVCVDVEVGTIAHQAGVKRGDKILAIGGMDVAENDIQQIPKVLPSGRDLTIEFARRNVVMEAFFSLTEEDIRNIEDAEKFEKFAM